MTKLRKTVLTVPLLFATGLLPLSAQRNNYNNFNNGVRQGGHGGNYYNGHDDQRYRNDQRSRDDRRYHDDHRRDNGIGPGKGALIGGAGGAALGAVFGGGLKGTIIGGAAGAGIGAVIGNAAQNNRRNNYR